MSGQFDRMDFGDLELGVCYPLLCEWVCIVYKKTVLCFIDILTWLNIVFLKLKTAIVMPLLLYSSVL